MRHAMGAIPFLLAIYALVVPVNLDLVDKV